MAYTVHVKKSAVKELAQLPRREQRRIASAIDDLATAPRPTGARKLVGTDDTYRLRVGDYRVLYELVDDRLVVLVIRIGHRKDIYRKSK